MGERGWAARRRTGDIGEPRLRLGAILADARLRGHAGDAEVGDALLFLSSHGQLRLAARMANAVPRLAWQNHGHSGGGRRADGRARLSHGAGAAGGIVYKPAALEAIVAAAKPGDAS
jgi:hypothetical protein